MKSFQFLLVALCASFSVALANPEEATAQLTRRALYEKRGGCTKSYKAQSGDTCSSIASKFNVSVNNLYSWNSNINNPSCNNLHIGTSYCVSKSTTKRSSTAVKKSSKKSTKKTTTKPKTTTKKSGGGSSGSGGAQFTGDGTYYNTGLGSCGHTNTDTQLIAALNAPQMGSYPNPNNNPNCGKFAMVHGPKGSVRVQIVDTCPPCAYGSLDLSPAAFAKIADLATGRIKISWSWD